MNPRLILKKNFFPIKAAAIEMGTCVKCCEKVEKDQCELCGRFLCRDCSNVTATEIRALELQSRHMLRFYCSSCQTFIKDSYAKSNHSNQDSVMNQIFMETLVAKIEHTIERKTSQLYNIIDEVKNSVSSLKSGHDDLVKIMTSGSTSEDAGGSGNLTAEMRHGVSGIPIVSTCGGQKIGGAKQSSNSGLAPILKGNPAGASAGEKTEGGVPNAVDKTQRRKGKIEIVRGVAEVSSVPIGMGGSSSLTFAAVARRAYLYVGNVNMSATEDVLKNYLKHKFADNEFIIEALPKRDDAQSRAFKLVCDYSLLNDLYRPELWPNGVIVKRFFRGRGQNKQSWKGSSPV